MKAVLKLAFLALVGDYSVYGQELRGGSDTMVALREDTSLSAETLMSSGFILGELQSDMVHESTTLSSSDISEDWSDFSEDEDEEMVAIDRPFGGKKCPPRKKSKKCTRCRRRCKKIKGGKGGRHTARVICMNRCMKREEEFDDMEEDESSAENVEEASTLKELENEDSQRVEDTFDEDEGEGQVLVHKSSEEEDEDNLLEDLSEDEYEGDEYGDFAEDFEEGKEYLREGFEMDEGGRRCKVCRTKACRRARSKPRCAGACRCCSTKSCLKKRGCCKGDDSFAVE